MRILYVEDQETLAEITAKRLRKEGYSVDTCGDGREALSYIDACAYDVILLDILLPGMNGIEVLQYIRAQKQIVPVLMLTAKDSIGDRVEGLDSGADDYLVKPFSYEELSARIRALLRRQAEEKRPEIVVADLTMDTARRQVFRAGEEIPLTAKEYSLLECLMRNAGLVLTRDQIIEHVWDFDFDSDSNIVDVYIRYLRRKIDKAHEKKLIHTIRGSGYAIRE